MDLMKYIIGNNTNGDLTPPTNRTSANGTYDLSLCINVTVASVLDDDTIDGRFIYIIVVLCFYALSMVLLMVKYIRREEEEISLDHYYTEFVKREQFQSATYQNKLLLEKTIRIDAVSKVLTGTRDKGIS